MNIDTGDTAWVLAATALVLFMTPGLALFYGGMVRAKNVLAMLMQNFFAMGIVAVLWAIVCYSLAFGDLGDGGWLGNFDFAAEGLRTARYVRRPIPLVAVHGVPDDVRRDHARVDHRRDRRPHAVQRVGVVRRRSGRSSSTRRSPTGCSRGGWLAERGALDFAGGTVVHVNAGSRRARRRSSCSACAAAGRGTPMPPHSLPLTLLGTGILWFGWFGFNAGSALGRQRRRRAGVRQHVRRRRRPRCSAGSSSSGSRAATPRRSARRRARSRAWSRSRRAADSSAGWRRSTSGSSPASCAASRCSLKFRFGYDDSLDVIGVHLVGGIIGSVLLGLFADASVNPAGTDGVFFGGGWGLFGEQVLAVAVVARVLVRRDLRDLHRAEDGAPGRHPRRPRRRSHRPRPHAPLGGRLLVHRPLVPGTQATDTTVKLVVAIIKPFKLDDVKAAVQALGVQGLTVTERAGLRPPARSHRGVPRRGVHRRLRAEGQGRDPRRRRRRRRASSRRLIEAARTGKIGDGKVWTMPVEDVHRVRTGEAGIDAI